MPDDRQQIDLLYREARKSGDEVSDAMQKYVQIDPHA